MNMYYSIKRFDDGSFLVTVVVDGEERGDFNFNDETEFNWWRGNQIACQFSDAATGIRLGGIPTLP